MKGEPAGTPRYTARPPVTLDLQSKDWLDRLVAEELARYDAAAARARLPHEIRPGALGADLEPGCRLLVARSLRHRRLESAPQAQLDAFLDQARGHVGLVLDLALLAGEPFHRHRRRASIAACLAAALDEPDLALDADPAHPDPASPISIERALEAAGRALRLRFHPPGDPKGGLPLHHGQVAVLRRHLARVAMGAHRTGALDAEALARHRAFAHRELVLLVEAQASLLAAAGPAPDQAALDVRHRQLARLGLPRAELREARRATGAPRPAAVLAAAAPVRTRHFLLEQLLLAQLRAGLPAEPSTRFTDAFAAGAGLDAADLAAAQVEAAAEHDDHLAWLEAVGPAGQTDWQAVAAQWEEAADVAVEKVTDAVTQNLEAVVSEIRETGELGQLLAKAAAGGALSAEEKRKVKEQLIDLAKAVPALAIFAAPGGMLLLPLLAKLLPFSVLPSSWDKDRRRPDA